MPGSYTRITQDEAKEMMKRDDGHVIVDVRRKDEYKEGHIPGAICIPNERIIDEEPEELPDLDQIILIYCRSGNRSKQAAQKLYDIGYSNIYEFGGIMEWTSGKVAGAEPGETAYTEAKDNTLVMKINDTEVPVTWEDNASKDALQAFAEEQPLMIKMTMYGGFEQVGPLGRSIVRDDKQTTTKPGDIVLYSGNQIVVFYGSNSWSYTRLGHVDLTTEELNKLLGQEDVELKLEVK